MVYRLDIGTVSERRSTESQLSNCVRDTRKNGLRGTVHSLLRSYLSEININGLLTNSRCIKCGVNINNNYIPDFLSAKYLGIMVDLHLKWDLLLKKLVWKIGWFISNFRYLKE